MNCVICPPPLLGGVIMAAMLLIIILVQQARPVKKSNKKWSPTHKQSNETFMQYYYIPLILMSIMISEWMLVNIYTTGRRPHTLWVVRRLQTIQPKHSLINKRKFSNESDAYFHACYTDLWLFRCTIQSHGNYHKRHYISGTLWTVFPKQSHLLK